METPTGAELTMIRCKGRVPGTTRTCGAELFETDGTNFYLSTKGGMRILLEIDPPRVRCSVCGYKRLLGTSKPSKPKSVANL